jgi:hypothetical protein
MSMGSGGIFGTDPDAMYLPTGLNPAKRKRGPLGLLEGGEDYEAFMPKVNQNDQSAINEYASAPEQKGLLSFWQGGEKFGGRDALSGLLMAVGDAFDREGGGEGGSLNAMIGGRAKAMADAQAAAKKSAERDQLIDAGVAAGRTREQMNLIVGGAANYGDFKAPTPNDTERDYNFMMQTVGKEAADSWLRRRGDPFVNMTLPNNQFYSGPQSGLQTALGGYQSAPPPAAPVGKLTPIGGPQGSPAGGFRR